MSTFFQTSSVRSNISSIVAASDVSWWHLADSTNCVSTGHTTHPSVSCYPTGRQKKLKLLVVKKIQGFERDLPYHVNQTEFWTGITGFGEISIKLQHLFVKRMLLKMSEKWWPFCSSLCFSLILMPQVWHKKVDLANFHKALNKETKKANIWVVWNYREYSICVLDRWQTLH